LRRTEAEEGERTHGGDRMKPALIVLTVTPLFALCSCSGSAATPASETSATKGSMAPTSHMRDMPPVPATVADWARGALLFEGLGNVHRPITTSSGVAQKFFDQGLALMWGFNHDEATRSFAKAAELDPACAACFWGVSLTVGPNYNLPFLVEQRAKVAFDALAKARDNMSRASMVEQALIKALASRYPTTSPLDPAKTTAILVAYADSMKTVAARFPDDLDVQALYAEALMNVNAWKLWTPDGKPAADTERIVAILESVLARDPGHPGANHYLVHALEASPHPERALAAAERLKTLMPAAGHMVHMPAHIMQRIGRYEDAAEANRRGAAADESYANRTRPLDYYPVMYTAHNYQFLACSAAMEGRKAEAIAAADGSRKAVSDAMLFAMPGTDWYVAESYTARVRFGLWDDLLAMPPPNPKLVGLTGGFLYGRAVALAAKGRLGEARVTLGELQTLMAQTPADAPAGMNSVREVLAVAIPIIQARIAVGEGRFDAAVASLRQAVAAEDRLAYNEPKDWFFPARHLLGEQLMQAGKPHEAEIIYREDLQRNPANGWALYGLSAALKAEGKTGEAAEAARQFESAWRHADIKLTASAF
jgi:tetratricopeptide (TPR) repeat protein